MRQSVLILFARQVFSSAFKNNASRLLLSTIAVLVLYAAYNGISTYQRQTQTSLHYQREVQEHWENMPYNHLF